MSTQQNPPSWIGWLQFGSAVAGLLASLFASQNTAPGTVTQNHIDAHVDNIKAGAAIVHNNTIK